MLFFNNVRIQIAAAAFLLILEISYFKCRKLPLLSTKCFTAMMLFSIVNIVFDFLTVYSIVYIDVLPHWIVRLCHQIFIGSLNAIMLTIFLYVDILNGNQKRYSIKKCILIFGSFGVSILLVIFGELHYFKDEISVYSYGPMAKSVYFIAFLYVLMISRKTILITRDSVIHTKQRYILITMGIWILIVGIQYHYPRLLLSGLGLSLMIFLMYLSFENPKDFINPETNTFNDSAYRLMVQEKTSQNKPFYILDIVFDDIREIERNIGRPSVNRLLTEISSYLMETCNTRVFSINETTFSLLISIQTSSFRRMRSGGMKHFETDRGIYESMLNDMVNQIAVRFSHSWMISLNKIQLKVHLNLFNYPKDVHSMADIYDMHQYILQRHFLSKNNSQNCVVCRIDKEFIEHKNRYITILNILTDAMTNDGFEIFYQPIYSSSTGGFISAEALLRLKDSKTVGYVSPEEFIPIVENNNLIMDISATVFDKVFAFITSQNLRSKGVRYVEINLSGIQCMDAGLPRQIQTLLQGYNLPSDVINFEITESSAIQSPSMLIENMKKLRQIGCSFAMDDFGTGYSNISQMASVHYELIKIDKSLLWPCFDDTNKDKENAQIILQNIVCMIQKLNTDIVAEGVETEEQFQFLKALNIPYMQGYYFSKPLSEDSYIEFLHKNQKTV